MRRRYLSILAVAGLAIGAMSAPATQAQAVQSSQDRVVDDLPATNTPNVLDGQVEAVVRVPANGNTPSMMIIGGQFTQVQPPGGATVTRNNIVAFNESTGQLSTTFLPQLDGEVTALMLSPDSLTVYVGGFFNNVNGAASQSLVQLNVNDGTRTAFRPPSMDGRVKDLRLVNGRLWVAGTFQTVAGQARSSLYTANPATGAVDPYFGLTIAGMQNGGTTQVLKMDVNPAGTRLVGIGNFRTVAGADRRQIFMLDITGASAQLADWQTNFYTSTCASVFNTYMRDLDFSPDGSYFVVSTTGAYNGSNSACDQTSRWQTADTGSALTPRWTDYTGGDTTYAVAITGAAVYVGGHFRWQNNPLAGDRAGAGAVSREGIAALDPANGLPLSWNPGRTKGVGVFDMLGTSSDSGARQGLWVASDTDRIGNFSYRARIALMPLAGGEVLPPNVTGTLPGTVFLAGRLSAPNADDVQFRHVDINGHPDSATSTMPSTGIAWGNARGAVMIDGSVYYGFSDGNFYKRTFNGTTFGSQVAVNTQDQIISLASWHADVPNITAMFFDRGLGRLYYTLNGQSSLFYRYFTPESSVVGTLRFTASPSLAGVNFANAGGAFLVGTKLYLADRTNGSLSSVTWTNGVPTGTGSVVDTSADWRTRGLFLSTVGVTPPTNQNPVANATVTCTGLDCTYDGTASTDSDGTITSYQWTFGDNQTGSGATATHSYAAAGTYTVTLTVTDNQGGTNSTTRSVSVGLPTVPISFVGATSANGNTTSQSVTVPAGVATGDAMLLFASVANTTATISDPAGWTLVGTRTGNSIQTKVWRRVVAPGDAGSGVTVGVNALSKYSVTLAAYHGTAADPVAAFASAGETATTATHTTPTVASPANGWVVSYVADNTSATTTWSVPAQTVRDKSFGTGGGRICSVVADSNANVAAGTVGGVTATADAASAKATMWTIVLAD